MSPARWVVVPLGLAWALGACSRRPHVGGQKSDAGPSVVVVERKLVPVVRPGRSARDEVAFVDEKEPNDDVARAQPIEFPKGIRGTLAAAVGSPGKRDVDVFQWLAGGEGKQALRVELTGDPPKAKDDAGGAAAAAADNRGGLTLEVLDGGGELPPLAVGESAADGTLVVTNLAVDVGKTYYLVVRERAAKAAASKKPAAVVATGAQNAKNSSGIGYRLSLVTAPLAPGEEEEPNDSPARANAMIAGVEETGFFGRSHDEDWLRLPAELPAGGTLRIELATPEGVAAGLRLRDAAGAIVVETRAGKGEELRLRNAPMPTAGVGADTLGWLLSLRAETGKNLNDKWTLRFGVEAVMNGTESEPNGSVSLANRIELDAKMAGGAAGGGGAGTGGAPSVGVGPAGSTAGFLWPGDSDVFRFNGAGPGLLRVEVTPPEHVDVKLERLGEQGTVLEKADATGAGKRERLTLIPLSGSDILVRVSARLRDTAFDAPYTLSWSLTAADDTPPP